MACRFFFAEFSLSMDIALTTVVVVFPLL